MNVVTSSIGTVLEQIIHDRTGLAMSCAECKDDIAILNSMTPGDVLATVHKHAGRIVNRAMSRRQPWYLRLCAMAAPKLAIATVSRWITEACDRHISGELNVCVQVIPDEIAEQRPSLMAGEIPAMIPRSGRFDGRCVAVTSLNPNPKRVARQLQCVRSWHSIGLDVIAVNTAAEFDLIYSELLSMVRPVVSANLSSAFSRKTPKVSSLIAAGISSGLAFVIVNADVEMYGDGEAIEAALALPDYLTIGIRWNHSGKAGRESARIERHGIDAFLMTAELAEKLPETEFGIGMPAWDYFVPHHLRLSGHKINWITQPMFFHEDHSPGWAQADWAVGAAMMLDRYGVNIASQSPTFREQLEITQ